MRRRRRSQREITFSFDSFLDVVANVVGIILRLILVAWIGARTYKAFVPPAPPPPASLGEPASLPEPTDERIPLLAQRRIELERQREVVLSQSKLVSATSDTARQLARDLLALQQQYARFEEERRSTEKKAQKRSTTVKQKSSSLKELQDRVAKITQEIDRVQKTKSPSKTLRYRTPISTPLQTEEMMFECRQGKVSLIDHGAMLAEISREVKSKEEALRTSWSVTEMTAPVGPFRLRYVIEREKSPLDVPGVQPSDGTFRYGVTRWEVVPITQERGESAEQALSSDSAFRQIVDTLDPRQTAITFWVYPDSFALYRKLRDFLHDREIVVAGRPLPDGIPIASSRHGTISRGQ